MIAQIYQTALVALGMLSWANAQTDFSVVNNQLSTWNNSEWSLTTNTLIQGQYQARPSLANGYFGCSITPLGPFFEVDINQTDPKGTAPTNGWPLFSTRQTFCTISFFYDLQPSSKGVNYPELEALGWSSFISGIPYPTTLLFAFGDEYLDSTVDNSTISNFQQVMSFKTGVLETSYTWAPKNTAAYFNVTYETFFHRTRENVAVTKAIVTPSADINGTITDLFDGRSAARTYPASSAFEYDTPTISTSFHPVGQSDVTGVLFSTANFSSNYTDSSSRVFGCQELDFIPKDNLTTSQTFNIKLKAGEPATFYKFVGAASTDKFGNSTTAVARNASLTAFADGYEILKEEHIQAWADLLPVSAVDSYSDPATGELPANDENAENTEILQINAVANTYYLLQNLQGGDNDFGVTVGGLASDSYGGLVFWDQDYWIGPGMNVMNPEYSKQITGLRVRQYLQSLENARFYNFTDGAVLWSWCTGRYGNCTATGPCYNYEYHLNYDLSFNIEQVVDVTNDLEWYENGPVQVVESVANLTSQLLQYNATTQTYWIHNMTDPDEYANNVDNGAFTVASAAKLLGVANKLRELRGIPRNTTWDDQASKVALPRTDIGITKEYQTMNDSVAVKQADVVLLPYPLEFQQNLALTDSLNYTTTNSIQDLDYYSFKQSPNGPGMTWSIYSINENALASSGSASYSYALTGVLPYSRAPWYQFSEQTVDDFDTNGGTNPAFPFLTGHGGAHQINPFGFLGLRTTGTIASISPSLPPQISYLRLRTIYYSGAGISAQLNNTHTVLTRLNTTSHTSLYDAYANTTLPITITSATGTETFYIGLSPQNNTITILNRQPWASASYTGNILQSASVSTPDAYAPGQVPEGAVDGANSTRWQPASDVSSSLLVNLTRRNAKSGYKRLSGVDLNWGPRTPRNATILLANSTNSEGLRVAGTMTGVVLDDVTISQAFNASADVSVIRQVVGNGTVVDFGEQVVWSADYVELVLGGCWEDDGVGGTVGEFVLF